VGTNDPKFVNYQANGTEDYHITSVSAALDKGDTQCGGNPSPCVPSTDFDGVSRPQGTAIDIGAYEQ
jgi:hypothetical protein